MDKKLDKYISKVSLVLKSTSPYTNTIENYPRVIALISLEWDFQQDQIIPIKMYADDPENVSDVLEDISYTAFIFSFYNYW